MQRLRKISMQINVSHIRQTAVSELHGRSKRVAQARANSGPLGKLQSCLAFDPILLSHSGNL